MSDKITTTHHGLHNNSDIYTPFNSLNYSDDIAGCEPTFERATLSFSVMGIILVKWSNKSLILDDSANIKSTSSNILKHNPNTLELFPSHSIVY